MAYLPVGHSPKVIIRILYNIVYAVLLVPFAVVFAAAMPLRLRREFNASWKERLGIYPPQSGDASLPSVIVRCASLGETKVALRFIQKISGCRFIIAAGTLSARDCARQYLNERDVVFTPVDLYPFVRRFFSVFRPAAVIFVESDLWPEFLFGARDAGARSILVNGRFSPSSVRLGSKFKKLSREMLSLLEAFLVRYDSDTAALAVVGIAREKIGALGNIKYDFGSAPQQTSRVSMGYSDGDFVIVAGSTHLEDEKALAVALGKGIFASRPELKIVVVPRHVERAAQTAAIFKIFAPALLSAARSPAPRCLIVDKNGELEKYYSVASAAFIGGSFGTRGGQEPMTPAFFGKPVIYGPRMSKFADETSRLEAAGGAVRVASASALAEVLEMFAGDPAAVAVVGKKAKSAAMADVGAASRAAERVKEFIEGIPR